MEIKILAFGVVAEYFTSGELLLHNVNTTDELRGFLDKIYPTLKSTNYALAINRKIVTTNTTFCDGDEIALLPPFSGG